MAIFEKKVTIAADDKVVHVAKNGDDDFDGLTVQDAVATFARALIIADTLNPQPASAVTIRVEGADEFVTNLELTDHINLDMPRGKLVSFSNTAPTLKLNTGNRVRIGDLENRAMGGTALQFNVNYRLRSAYRCIKRHYEIWT